MRRDEPAVLAEGLAKSYGGTAAVVDFSLRVEVGETVGVLGTNGAGKTTSVEMVAGLRAPDRGTVRVLGLEPRTDRARVRQVLGVQLQESHLHGSLRVSELVDLYRTFYPDPRPADELLDLVQLTEQRRTRFERLSGGQQQRLSVALALVGRPRVVILDELTTGLDPKARRRMWGTVQTLQAEGVSVLLVSHAMEEVERLCHRIVLVDAGRVAYLGTAAGLRERFGGTSLEEAFVRVTGTEPEEAG
ncbi:ABC transporter ATP-binding protein [Ornithinimicrobium sp. LYQ92]|uniref:ABC transporter ATP-binding protein n=1 Tax=Serinicoccus sp. LYQ92 TaxID=3378798 RepID=UPI0038520E50